MTTSHCSQLPEVLPERRASSPLSDCTDRHDPEPMSSLDCSLDPALPGKAMEDESCPRDGGEKAQYYMQVSAKEGQLLSNVLAKQRYVPVHQLVQQGVGCGFDSQ